MEPKFSVAPHFLKLALWPLEKFHGPQGDHVAHVEKHCYRVRLPAVARCRIMLESEKMEEVSEFKYLESVTKVLHKHGGMEREIREQVMKGRSVVGSLAGVMKGRNVSMDMKKGLRNSILLPTLTYELENQTWHGAQQSRGRALEMSYLRGACGVSRWDGLSNESVYERCGMTGHVCGVGWGGVGWGGMGEKEHPEMVWPY